MDTRELIELESEAAEASRDLPEPDGVTGRRVKGGTVLSVRLNEEGFAALTELAHAKAHPDLDDGALAHPAGHAR